MQRDQGRKIAGEFEWKSIDLSDLDPAAADRTAGDSQHAFAVPFERKDHRVGMGRIAQTHHFKMKGQSGLGSMLKRMGNAGIIGLLAHQPGDQRPIGTVAFAGSGK